MSSISPFQTLSFSDQHDTAPNGWVERCHGEVLYGVLRRLCDQYGCPTLSEFWTACPRIHHNTVSTCRIPWFPLFNSAHPVKRIHFKRCDIKFSDLEIPKLYNDSRYVGLLRRLLGSSAVRGVQFGITIYLTGLCWERSSIFRINCVDNTGRFSFSTTLHAFRKLNLAIWENADKYVKWTILAEAMIPRATKALGDFVGNIRSSITLNTCELLITITWCCVLGYMVGLATSLIDVASSSFSICGWDTSEFPSEEDEALRPRPRKQTRAVLSASYAIARISFSRQLVYIRGVVDSHLREEILCQ